MLPQSRQTRQVRLVWHPLRGDRRRYYYWWARSTAEEPGTEPPRVEEHSRDDYVESRLVYTTQTPEDNDEK